MRKNAIITLAGLLLLLPGMAMAHTGNLGTTGFLQGFSHPIGGFDHLLAMLAVGLWASQQKGRALWAVPCAFVVVMMLGSVLGLSAVHIPFIETGILLSILVLGTLIAGAFKLPAMVSVVTVAIFALCHGHAHGAEMHVSNSAIAYIVGFSLATAMLHLVGMGLGVLMQKVNLEKINRFAGAAIALSGLFLAL